MRDLCHREGIRSNAYYVWLKDFMEAGKERLIRDMVCASPELSPRQLAFRLVDRMVSRFQSPRCIGYLGERDW